MRARRAVKQAARPDHVCEGCGATFTPNIRMLGAASGSRHRSRVAGRSPTALLLRDETSHGVATPAAA